MDQREARELLRLAHGEPKLTLAQGTLAIDEIGEGDPSVLAVIYRAMALAARATDGASASIEFAKRSLRAAHEAGDDSLEAESLMTLAGSLALGGDNQGALEALDRAEPKASGLLAAEVRFQRGAVRARMGDSDEARAAFSSALLVFREEEDEESIAMTLHNLGMLNLYAGDPAQAIEDFEAARELESRLGMQTALAAVEHNIGVATASTGDLPRALEMLDASEALYFEFAESPAEVQVSRVEVLLTAGLFREAMQLADRVAGDLEAMGLAEDMAEAVLAGAVAARLSGDPEAAITRARRAESLFADQRRTSWQRNAAQVELGARLDAGAVAAEDVEAARRLADSLEAAGQADAAFNARLTAGLVALQVGADDAAIDELQAIAGETEGPVQRRLDATLARALVLELQGDPTGAESEAGAGFDLLDEYQAVLGASDVRAGVEKHASGLGTIGLRIAARSGTPRALLEWMERTRARSILYRPVRPPTDGPQAADLTSLRQIEFALREEDGGDVAALVARKEELEERVRDRSRHAPGSAERRVVHDGGDYLQSLLGESRLLEFGSIDGDLWLVSVSGDDIQARVVVRTSEVEREMEWHRFAMRQLARGRGDPAHAEASARRIDDLLFSNLAPDVGEGAVILAPLPSMYAFSWSALPTLQSNSTVVAPSAATWAARADGADALDLKQVAVLAGPDLDQAEDEVREVSAIYGESLRDGSVTTNVEDALGLLNGADIAHIASHASFVKENPLFSSLRLADGDLHVYDIELLEQPPDIVVLSACDSGFSSAQPGEELLGLSSALIAMGTRTVIASVGLVPDTSATKAMMVRLHEGIVAGLGPAAALHQAQESVATLPGGTVAGWSFVCIGAG